jgi:heme exporter protein C
MDGPTIDASILYPLLVMAIAFTSLFIMLHLKAMRSEILSRRVNTMLVTQVEQAARRPRGGPATAEQDG